MSGVGREARLRSSLRVDPTAYAWVRRTTAHERRIRDSELSDQQGGTQRAYAHAGAGACRGWHPRQRRLSGPPGTCVRAAAARFVVRGASVMWAVLLQPEQRFQLPSFLSMAR